jgi:hypothetical protein
MAFECVGNESITYYAESELRVAEAVKVVWCVCVSGKDVPLDDFRFFLSILFAGNSVADSRYQWIVA